jgi:hypothetical protein
MEKGDYLTCFLYIILKVRMGFFLHLMILNILNLLDVFPNGPYFQKVFILCLVLGHT